jgi:hypothetical protein
VKVLSWPSSLSLDVVKGPGACYPQLGGPTTGCPCSVVVSTTDKPRQVKFWETHPLAILWF